MRSLQLTVLRIRTILIDHFSYLLLIIVFCYRKEFIVFPPGKKASMYIRELLSQLACVLLWIHLTRRGLKRGSESASAHTIYPRGKILTVE